MRRLSLLILICLVGTAAAVYAQEPYDDYVSEVKGDTLVVKTFQEFDNNPSALVNAIDADSVDVPEGRVYELSRNGWYPILEDIYSPTDRPVTIVGEGNVRMTQGTMDDGFPAVLSGIFLSESESNSGDLFRFQNDATVKNIAMTPTHGEGTIGWTFFYASAPNTTLTLENVIMETTQWVFIQSNDAVGTNIKIRDSYFVNMTGYTCRRNGGVYDNVNHNTDTIFVENSTHIMGAGVIYKFRSYPITEAVFNHNTFVNISGQVLASWGHQNNYIVANNLFVNSNTQAYIKGLDYAEFDQDYLPHGIINIDTLRTMRGGETLGIDSTWIRETYPNTPVVDFGPDDRKVLVSNNGVYWDPKLDEIVQTLNNNDVPCPSDEAESDCIDPNAEWQSQMITMNARTQAMFNDDANYPYLTEGPWIQEGKPQFTDDAGLMSDAILQDLIDWSVSAASTPNEAMPHWRADGNPYDQNVVWSDYPVLPDLSYSNTAYLEGGVNGYPLGDLNWFPTEKESWMAQRDAEYAELQSAKEEGRVPTAIEKTSSTVPSKIKLEQNYPNPFNPTTQIGYELKAAANVEMTVYNTLGRKVATLVNNKMQKAGSYRVEFDASNLSSGVYIYKLKAGDAVRSKTMMLIK